MTPVGGPAPPGGPVRVGLGLVATVAARPDLWWSAAGALRRLASPGWWRTPTHLPVVAPELWAFRMVTAYGDAEAAPEPADVVSYLEWCRSTAPPRWPARVAARGRQVSAHFHPDRQSG